jgi:hypothetical protein
MDIFILGRETHASFSATEYGAKYPADLKVCKLSRSGVVLYNPAVPHSVEKDVRTPRQVGTPSDAVDTSAVLVAAIGRLLAPLLQGLCPPHPTLVRPECQ